MPRGFAERYKPLSPTELRQCYCGDMFHKDGTPTCEEVDKIIRVFLEAPQATISAMIVSKRTDLHPYAVRTICRQLVTGEHLIEDPPLGARFKLNTNYLGVNRTISQIREKVFQLDDLGKERKSTDTS